MKQQVYAVGQCVFAVMLFFAALCRDIVSESQHNWVEKHSGHTWLHDDKMLVGADNGDLLLFDNAGASFGKLRETG